MKMGQTGNLIRFPCFHLNVFKFLHLSDAAIFVDLQYMDYSQLNVGQSCDSISFWQIQESALFTFSVNGFRFYENHARTNIISISAINWKLFALFDYLLTFSYSILSL